MVEMENNETLSTSDIYEYGNLTDNTTMDCSKCVNDLCFAEDNYAAYEEWISVNNFETVLIILHIIQILTGILGNLLVRILYNDIKMFFYHKRKFHHTKE